MCWAGILVSGAGTRLVFAVVRAVNLAPTAKFCELIGLRLGVAVLDEVFETVSLSGAWLLMRPIRPGVPRRVLCPRCPVIAGGFGVSFPARGVIDISMVQSLRDEPPAGAMPAVMLERCVGAVCVEGVRKRCVSSEVAGRA